jgi:hypothetical protein
MHGHLLEELYVDEECKPGSGEHRPFTWAGMIRWPNGWNLARMLPSREAPEPVLRFTNYIESRLAGQLGRDARYPAELEMLSPFELIRFLAFVGRAVEGLAIRRSGVIVRSARESARAAEHCDNAMHQWSMGLPDYMNGIKRYADVKSTAPTLQTAFGPFYRSLFENFGSDTYRFFREAVVDFILREHPGLIDRRHKRIAQLGDLSKAAYMDGTHAARDLGIGLATLEMLIEDGVLPGQVLRGERLLHARVIVPRAGLVQARDLLSKMTSVHEIRRRHCIPKRLYGALISAGAIKIPEGCKAVRNFAFTTAIEHLVRFIDAHASADQPPEKTVTLAGVGCAVGSKATIPLLRDVFKGRVPFWRVAPTDQKVPLGVLLSVADVDEWRHRQARELAGDRISVPEFSKQFRLKQQVAYHLIRTGMLESERARVDFRDETLIKLSSVRTFFERYTSLSSRIPGLSSHEVRDHLGSLGIRPVVGPTIDGCRQYIYERTPAFDEAILRFTAEKVAYRARIAGKRAAAQMRAKATHAPAPRPF